LAKVKGCDSNFDVKGSIFKIELNNFFTRIALENYNNNDQQFNRHNFQ